MYLINIQPNLKLHIPHQNFLDPLLVPTSNFRLKSVKTKEKKKKKGNTSAHVKKGQHVRTRPNFRSKASEDLKKRSTRPQTSNPPPPPLKSSAEQGSAKRRCRPLEDPLAFAAQSKSFADPRLKTTGLAYYRMHVLSGLNRPVVICAAHKKKAKASNSAGLNNEVKCYKQNLANVFAKCEITRKFLL